MLLEGWQEWEGESKDTTIIASRKGRVICEIEKKYATSILDAQSLLKAVMMGDPDHKSWETLIERIRTHADSHSCGFALICKSYQNSLQGFVRRFE